MDPAPTSRLGAIHRYRRVALAVIAPRAARAGARRRRAAEAGTYRAVQCHESLGAGHPDAVFRQSSPTTRGRRTAAARPGRESARARPRADRAGPVRRLDDHRARRDRDPPPSPPASAPPKAATCPRLFVAHARRRPARSLTATATGTACGGRAPPAGRSPRRLACPAGRLRRGPRPRTCTSAGSRSRSATRSRPRSTTGTLLAPGARRGPQSPSSPSARLRARASARERRGERRPPGRAGPRLPARGRGRAAPAPVPGRRRRGLRLRDGLPPLSPGPEPGARLRNDYAQRATANLACATRTVRVDNLCPLSARRVVLDARFRGGSEPRHAKRPSRHRHRAVHRRGWPPVAGARVCVGARAWTGHAAEPSSPRPPRTRDGSQRPHPART